MIAINDSVKNAYKQYTTQRKPYIKVGDNTYYIQNMNLQADCYDEGNVIGNAIAKILKFDIETEYVEGLDEFGLYDSIWTGNQYESVFLGTFKLYDEEGTDDYFSSVTAYDKLLFFNIQYNPNLTDYPTTIFGLLQSICSQAGVELTNTEVVNGNQILESNLFVEGETLKIILNAICQISGTYAVISNDKLKLMLKGSDTIILGNDQISEPEFKRTTWSINQVVLGMTNVEGEDIKYPSDESIVGEIHKLVINDNPFVYTQELREAYIENIYNQVAGFGYEAMSMKWEGLSYIELGDLLSVDGHNSITLRYNIKSPNGLESTLEAPSIIDSVVEYYNNSNSLNNRIQRTEYVVDKQNQTITQIVEKQTEQGSQLTQQEMTLDGITTTVSNIQSSLDDYATTEEVTNIIEQTIESTTNIIQKTGGFNLLLNTQWYQDLAEWEVSAANDYSVDYESADVLQNTESKSELNINTATVKQTFQTMIGQTVTISFKYKKAGVATGGNSYVRLYRSDDDYVSVLEATEAQEDRKQVKLTYTSTVNTPTLVINSDRDDFWITDLVIQYGESDVWSPNATETRGQNYSLTLDGLYLKDIASGEEMHLTGNKLQFENGFYGNGEMQTEEGTFTQSLNVCGLTYTYIDDDNVIVN